MSKAVLCPICGGSGKVLPPNNPFGCADPQPQTCHGCGGRGWVTVPDSPVWELTKEGG